MVTWIRIGQKRYTDFTFLYVEERERSARLYDNFIVQFDVHFRILLLIYG